MLVSSSKKDKYNLQSSGCSRNQISSPNLDTLASIKYSCTSWVDHLNQWQDNAYINDQDLQNNGIIHNFFKKKYVDWLKYLSLLSRIPDRIIAIKTLKTIIVGYFGVVQPLAIH